MQSAATQEPTRCTRAKRSACCPRGLTDLQGGAVASLDDEHPVGHVGRIDAHAPASLDPCSLDGCCEHRSPLCSAEHTGCRYTWQRHARKQAKQGALLAEWLWLECDLISVEPVQVRDFIAGCTVMKGCTIGHLWSRYRSRTRRGRACPPTQGAIQGTSDARASLRCTRRPRRGSWHPPPPLEICPSRQHSCMEDLWVAHDFTNITTIACVRGTRPFARIDVVWSYTSLTCHSQDANRSF